MTASGLNPAIVETKQSPEQIQQQARLESIRPTDVKQAEIFNKIIEVSNKYDIDVETALKIARCESGFRQFNKDGSVVRGQQNRFDVGIFQINEKYHLERSQTLGMDIDTLDGNIEYAVWTMKKEGTKPWNWSKPCWSQELNSASANA